ncbi:MAG TPA: hypothetical protein VL201_02700, partial [Patescibacteria group bacterium]|nr:hypothetical protein [Patescibacteria group bacterium]
MKKRFFLYYVFCVLCSASVMFGMYEEEEKESTSEQQVNKSFELPVQVKKSFIFKTAKPNERLVLLKVSDNSYQLLKITENTKPEVIAAFTFIAGFQEIENYIPFAHKTVIDRQGDSLDQYYFYAVTKQKSTFLSKDLYRVVEISIICD